jgi:site-specific DNA-cytosine methylase
LPAYFEKYGGPTIPQQNIGRPIALDIFAGGGGMSIGLERAGWNVKYKVDMNAACCETLESNFEGKSVFKEDVAKFLRKLKLGKLNIDTKNIALIHGSPPCQGFSMASKCFCSYVVCQMKSNSQLTIFFSISNDRHKRWKKRLAKQTMYVGLPRGY